MSERNKENKSTMKMRHTTGNTPFPVIRERMRIEDPNLLPPTRIEMFEKTYTSQETGVPIDPESAERLESLRTSLRKESEDRQKDKDVQETFFQEVMGRDRRGRVRMFGGGVTPKDVFGKQSMHDQKRAEEMAHLREEKSQLKEEMVEQRAKLTKMETQMQSLMEFMRSSQSSE